MVSDHSGRNQPFYVTNAVAQGIMPQWCPATRTGIRNTPISGTEHVYLPQWCPATGTGISLDVGVLRVGVEASMVSGHWDRNQA